MYIYKYLLDYIEKIYVMKKGVGRSEVIEFFFYCVKIYLRLIFYWLIESFVLIKCYFFFVYGFLSC